MQLVEDGKLSLDDPINDHLPPELRIPDEGFHKPILVRHLMTHTAGFEDSIQSLFVHDPTRLLPLDQSLAVHRVHRVREPGTLAVYSNYGAALAGALVANSRASRGRTTRSGASCARSAWRARPIASPIPRRSRPRSAFPRRCRPKRWRGQPTAFPGRRASITRSRSNMCRTTRRPERCRRAPTIWPPICRRCSTPRPWRRRACSRLKRRSLCANRSSPIRQGLRPCCTASSISARSAAGAALAMAARWSSRNRQWRSIPTRASRSSSRSIRRTAAACSTSSPACCSMSSIPRPIPRPRASRTQRSEGEKVAGVYRALRVPSFRSEAAAVSYFNAFTVRAAPSGNIVVGGERRYRPLGGGVFAEVAGQDRIAFHEQDGRMRMFDLSGAFPPTNWLLCDRPLAALDRRAGGGARLVGDRGGARTLHSRRSARRKRDRRPRRLEPVVAGGGSDLPRGRQCVGEVGWVLPLRLSRLPLSDRLLGVAPCRGRDAGRGGRGAWSGCARGNGAAGCGSATSPRSPSMGR